MSFAELVEKVRDWFSFSRDIYGNSLGRWAMALVLFVALLVLFRLAKMLTVRSMEKLAAHTPTPWRQTLTAALRVTKLWFFVVVSACVALWALELAADVATRIAIVELLCAEELPVGRICERLGLEQANASQHLAVLRNKFVVETRKEANQIFYRLRDPLLGEVLATMRRYFLSHMNEAVALLQEEQHADKTQVEMAL